MGLLDPRFRYVPAARTDVVATWRRFGFRPTTDTERRARQRSDAEGTADAPHGGLELVRPAPRQRAQA